MNRNSYIPEEYRLSVKEMRAKLGASGLPAFVQKEMLERYIPLRIEWRRKAKQMMAGGFDVYRNDPNCKSCKKKRL
jgi:hypothetical protein